MESDVTMSMRHSIVTQKYRTENGERVKAPVPEFGKTRDGHPYCTFLVCNRTGGKKGTPYLVTSCTAFGDAYQKILSYVEKGYFAVGKEFELEGYVGLVPPDMLSEDRKGEQKTSMKIFAIRPERNNKKEANPEKTASVPKVPRRRPEKEIIDLDVDEAPFAPKEEK